MRKAKRKNAQTNRSDARAEFRDLELHRWRFFLRPEETTSGADASALPDGFVDALNDAGAWLGWSEGALLRPDLHAAPADFSQRLVVAPADRMARTRRHAPHPGGAHAAGRLLPATGRGNRRRAPDAPAPCRTPSPPSTQANSGYLGDAECWCLMRTDGRPRRTRAPRGNPAARAAPRRLPRPSPRRADYSPSTPTRSPPASSTPPRKRSR
jgi:hypothetical protein